MPSYIQKAKTTHFRCGGDGWFRACWEIPNPGNAESFCGHAIQGIAGNVAEGYYLATLTHEKTPARMSAALARCRAI